MTFFFVKLACHYFKPYTDVSFGHLYSYSDYDVLCDQTGHHCKCVKIKLLLSLRKKIRKSKAEHDYDKTNIYIAVCMYEIMSVRCR